jgi:hypothetical protein
MSVCVCAGRSLSLSLFLSLSHPLILSLLFTLLLSVYEHNMCTCVCWCMFVFLRVLSSLPPSHSLTHISLCCLLASMCVCLFFVFLRGLSFSALILSLFSYCFSFSHKLIIYSAVVYTYIREEGLYMDEPHPDQSCVLYTHHYYL